MNKRKANARKRLKQQEAGEKRRLMKKILKLTNISNKGKVLQFKLNVLIEKYKSKYGDING